jgi:Rab proteins geranylgeranyltransferase component A
MSYTSRQRPLNAKSTSQLHQDRSGRVLAFPPGSGDLSFDDNVLDSVKEAWKNILGDEAKDDEFMRFQERELQGDDD